MDTPQQQSTDDEDANALAQCARERDEYLAGWQRAKADYANLQREMRERMGEEYESGKRNTIRELLTTLDHLAMAAHNIPDATKDEPWTRGVLDVKRDFEERLRQMGLEAIEALDTFFDPQYHEAIGEMPSDKPEGTVVEEVQKGYMYKGRVLRPARVKIAKIK